MATPLPQVGQHLGSGDRPTWRDPARWLVVIAWAVVVIPRLVQTFTVTKHRTGVADGVPQSAWSLRSERLLEVALLALCIAIFTQRARRLPNRGGVRLLALLSPWIFMVLRDLSVGIGPQISSLIYPFVVVAVWALRPDITALRPLAVLVGLTAAISLALGVWAPERGILTSIAGAQISPTKQLLPWGVLIGPFSDPNNLGQFLVLGVPAAGLIRGPVRRTALIVVTACALVWTSSRSSLAALIAAALLATVLAGLLPVTRRTVARVSIFAAAVVLVTVPLASRDDTSFTNRGYIWRLGLRLWRETPWLGHGSTWYAQASRYVNSLGQFAFHGHNQFVHALVTGGLLYLMLIGWLFFVIAGVSGTWAQRGTSYPAVQVVALLVSCTLEVSFGVVDRSFLLAVTVVPLAFFAFALPDGMAAPRRRSEARSSTISRAML